MHNSSWMKLIEYGVQKSFSVATGLIGIKLILIDSDISTYQGVIVTVAGCALISVASIIEYFVWKQRLTHTVESIEFKRLLQSGPGNIEAIAKYLRDKYND